MSAGAGTLTLSDLSPDGAGFGLTLAAGSQLHGATVVLDSAGGNLGVLQDQAGTVTAGTLAGTDAQNVLLDGTNNAIGAVTTLLVGGALVLADSVTLTEDATGTLDAGALGGSFGGDLRLGGTANAIGSLGSITVAGTLALTDGDPTLAGTVQAAQIALTVNGMGYSSGSLIARGPAPPGPVRPFFASGGTVEIAPRDVSVLNLGTASAGAPFVSAGVLGNIDAALLRLGEAQGQIRATGIAVNAPVTVSSQVATVDLEAAGPGFVTEANGASFALAGTLTGNTGAVALGGANAVPTLGPYNVNGGTFLLNDTGRWRSRAMSWRTTSPWPWPAR